LWSSCSSCSSMVVNTSCSAFAVSPYSTSAVQGCHGCWSLVHSFLGSTQINSLKHSGQYHVGTASMSTASKTYA
jgi:hypothetical protein